MGEKHRINKTFKSSQKSRNKKNLQKCKMPAENMEEQGLAKVPDLELAQLKFEVAHGLGGDKKLLASIKKEKMAPYYRSVCKELKWKEDSKLWSEMSSENEKELKEFDVKIADAETNLGESELRDALLAKAEYLTKIGDKDAAIEAVRKTMEKTVGLGNRMDLVFHNIRVGLFYMDHELIRANLDKANQLLEEGGDWDRRNRLKVYDGLYAIAVRDFGKAAKLFLETVSTFTSYELMDYTQFVKYAVYASIISLDRGQLYDKVVKGSEIAEVLHDCPDVQRYLTAFYNCHYGDFFQSWPMWNKLPKMIDTCILITPFMLEKRKSRSSHNFWNH